MDERKPLETKLNPKHIGILDSMPWWGPPEAAWQFKFESVLRYVARFKQVPPESHVE
jgi:hypothetical protein